MHLHEITIALAEPNQLIRKGFARIIKDFENCRVIFETGSGKELKEKLLTAVPHIILIEVQLQDQCGFEMIDWLQQYYPHSRVIVLTGFKIDLTQINLLRSGVRSIIKKNCSEGELRRTITTVMEQGFYHTDVVSRTIFNHLFNAKGSCGEKLQKTLTKREWEFIKLAASNSTYGEIASILQLSEPTVNKIRNQLFLKLEVANRTRLAMLALQNGIIAEAAA